MTWEEGKLAQLIDSQVDSIKCLAILTAMLLISISDPILSAHHAFLLLN
jgi:hypothetical protein